MAGRRSAFQNNPELQRFVLPELRATGRELGRGAYGSVEELKVNGLVYAGKRLYELLVEQDNDGVEGFMSKYLRECQMMAEMRHPHIVQFLGLCYLEGSTLPVLVMERLDNSLDKLLETSPSIPLNLKLSLLTDVAQGLHYLHTHNPQVVHRDLSARNVLLTSSLVAKISDLGNARIINLRPGQLAMTLSSVPGTLSYMPPESLREPSRYGPRLDIFSFGHLALFTLTQVFPGNLLSATYPDPDDNLLARSEVERRTDYIELLHKQLGEQHPLSQLVSQCLHNIPAQRPSAERVLQQLEAVRPQGAYGSLKMEMTKLQVAMMNVLKTEIEEHGERLQVKVDPTILQLRQKKEQLQQKDDQLKRKDVELQQKDDQLKRKDVELQQKDDQLKRKDVELQQKDDQLKRKDVELQQKDDQLKRKDVELQQKDDQLKRKDVELQQKDDQLKRKDVELQQKDDQLKRKDVELQQKDDQLKRKDVELQQKDDQLKQKDIELQQKDDQLKRKCNELQGIINRQQRELQTLREENRRLQVEKRDKDAQLIRQQRELKTLREDRGRLQAEVEVKVAEIESHQRELQIWRAEMDARSVQFQQQLQERDGEIREMLSERAEFTREIERIRAELKEQDERMLSERAEFTREIERIRAELKEQDESSGQCQRPECVRLHKEQMQKEVQQMVNHDQLIQDFESLTTDIDGVLGVLEDALHEHGDEASFEARKLLCDLFQESYDNCKKEVIHAISVQLESLFVVQPTKTQEIEDASQGYGMLLHAFGLREISGSFSVSIKTKISHKTLSNETLQKVKETLESSDEDYLGKVIELAWKFVALPNPLIVGQPKKFDSRIHEPEYGHWDKHADKLPLIYTRPVVYRNYEGVVIYKGWVANTANSLLAGHAY